MSSGIFGTPHSALSEGVGLYDAAGLNSDAYLG